MLTTLIFLAGLFYIVPFVRIVCGIVSAVKRLRSLGSSGSLRLRSSRLACWLSECEYYLSPVRAGLVFLPLLVVLIFYLVSVVRQGLPVEEGPVLAWLLALNGIHFLHAQHQRRTQVRFIELLRAHPRIHPEDFFSQYKRHMAWDGELPVAGELPDLTLADADFRKKQRPELKLLPALKGFFDTITIAGFILRAFRDVGEDYAREISDLVGVLLGKRILQYAEASLVVSGQEKLSGKSGHFVLIGNHKSSLDFVFVFFVLSETLVAGPPIKPRFIVAKDHFRDNPWIYHVMGIGRAVEIMDMIFIERKDRGKSFANLKEAARTVVTHDVDVAIYPQGTRASGNFDRAGKRRDAGYYTTVSRRDPNAPLSHLKKGAGYLVFDILDELSREGRDEEVHLVFMGVSGAATTLPKGSLTIQTENTIEYHIGDVISLSPALLKEIAPDSISAEEKSRARVDFARRLNLLIDEKLKQAIHLQEGLRKRYVADLKGHFQFDEEKIQVIAVGLDRISEQADVAYRILDRVYSLEVTKWNGYLSQLSQLLMGKLEEDRFEALLTDVTGVMLEKK